MKKKDFADTKYKSRKLNSGSKHYELSSFSLLFKMQPYDDWSLEGILDIGEFLEGVDWSDGDLRELAFLDDVDIENVDAVIDDRVIENDVLLSTACCAFPPSHSYFHPIDDREPLSDAWGGGGVWKPTTPSGYDPATVASVSPSPSDFRRPLLPSRSDQALVQFLFLPDLDESLEGIVFDDEPSGPFDEDMTTPLMIENSSGKMALPPPPIDQPSLNPITKKRGRKFPPELKTPVDLKKEDVLCGPGGHNRQHPGNVEYVQDVKDVLQIRFSGVDYRNDVPESVKMAVSQEIVARVHERGGRIVKRDRTDADWYEDSYHNARLKASQCLRDQALLIRRNAAAAAALPFAEPFEGRVDG